MQIFETELRSSDPAIMDADLKWSLGMYHWLNRTNYFPDPLIVGYFLGKSLLEELALRIKISLD